MRLTKERCIIALEQLESDNYEDFLEAMEVFGLLIDEHFDNPPLTKDELKRGMWVWDNKDKMFGKVLPRENWRNGILSTPAYTFGEFEENRLFRKQVVE